MKTALFDMPGNSLIDLVDRELTLLGIEPFLVPAVQRPSSTAVPIEDKRTRGNKKLSTVQIICLTLIC